MSTKRLISTSIITLFTASMAQAADIMVPRESRPVTQMSKQVSSPAEMSPSPDIPPVISAPTFSWDGFYLGGQIGGFSGKTDISLYVKKSPGMREWTPVEKDTLPQLSGVMGGLYAGANVDLGNSLILGVDTDIVWSNKEDTKVVAKRKFEEIDEIEEIDEVEEVEAREEKARRELYERARVQPKQPESFQRTYTSNASSTSHVNVPLERKRRNVITRDGYTTGMQREMQQYQQQSSISQVQNFEDSERVQVPSLQKQQQRLEARPSVLSEHSRGRPVSSARHAREAGQLSEIAEIGDEIYSNTLKQKWSGATRVRIGFAVDRIMPYIAGGVAYAQLQNIFSRSLEIGEREISSFSLSDTKMMVGYTLGGGVDFAMADNVILRAEYRYSDFGKQKFAKDKLELDYQTNDFRVGVAYKF
ncbi:outer membrane protein [Bartonella sp. WD16.2]|uniref:outer membrane protein n=1 Tax=Bartonella sp. WD16.2 TaxID=1933904 RepID=UPI00099A6111|nr:outer membrane protein [Bartonella sp. WD16.2]AQX19749.1 Outer membrane protein beta-barrel domain-containing protein [Bartonella sp. WD16.2]